MALVWPLLSVCHNSFEVQKQCKVAVEGTGYPHSIIVQHVDPGILSSAANTISVEKLNFFQFLCLFFFSSMVNAVILLYISH